VKGAADRLRKPRRIVDLVHPFGDAAEHLPVVDLLERLAPAHLARHLADQEDHRRRILPGDVHAGRGVGGAGPARHHCDAGPARELAVGFRHHRRTAFLAADDVADGCVVERVEQAEIALARDAERHVDALDLQLIGQDLAAGTKIGVRGHEPLAGCAWSRPELGAVP
jgi:hypothetical protein